LAQGSGSRSLGVVVPIIGIVLILVIDVLEGPATAFIGLLAVVPMFAAVFSGPVVTARIAGVTWLAALVFGIASAEPSGPAQSMRLAVIALASILAVFASALRRQQEMRLMSAEREAAEVGEIRRMSETDELTGVRNRRGVLKSINDREANEREANLPRTVALIDIDDFKAVNDAYGHQVGDEYITAAARRLAGALASTDLVGRWGGDEFLVVLDAGAARSAPVLARAHAAVTSEPIRVRDHLIPVAVSIGVADWNVDQPLDAALATADQALYEAKLAGRNRTTYPG